MADKEKKNNSNKKPKPSPYRFYVNREMSWLEFNLRVLLEAADASVPLLERLKFLAIYQSNLDEFYRVRVGILTHRAQLTPDMIDTVSGWTPAQQIDHIQEKVAEQRSIADSIWKKLKSEFKDAGIDVMDFRKMAKVDELMCKKVFGDIKHQLAPQILDFNQKLPFLWDGESYVVAVKGRGADMQMILIPLERIPPYIAFEIDGRQKIVLTERLVRHFVPLLYKKEDVWGEAIIKVTRNADVFLEEKSDTVDSDARKKMETMLKKRRTELPVRMQVYGKLAPQVKEYLMRNLGLAENSVFVTNAPFNLSFRPAIPATPGMKNEERRPNRDLGLKKGEYIPYIEKKDLLLSFPFQSVMPFVDLLYEAADDPDVLSIKITLYRLASSSKIAAALAYAADQGKDVLCLLELRARFDEQNNIDYSEMLEDAGCTVVYGLPGHKVHSKLCVITRQKDGRLCHITQVGTGNYNEVTGEQYTDLSLITSSEDVAQDAEQAFRALVEGKFPPPASTLWIAPESYKDRLFAMLDREIEKGENGHVVIKANSLNSVETMEKLIQCSRAGVKVELFIRGICCLRPGLPETENITVKSVVGRWLEHSRIFRFGDGEDERIFIGSGDLLNRNLERRVEAFIEVVTPDTKDQVRHILDAFREDNEKGRVMQPDGTYLRLEGGEGTSSQESLYWYFREIRCSEEEPAPVQPVPVEPTEEAASPVPEKIVMSTENEPEEKLTFGQRIMAWLRGN